MGSLRFYPCHLHSCCLGHSESVWRLVYGSKGNFEGRLNVGAGARECIQCQDLCLGLVLISVSTRCSLRSPSFFVCLGSYLAVLWSLLRALSSGITPGKVKGEANQMEFWGLNLISLVQGKCSTLQLKKKDEKLLQGVGLEKEKLIPLFSLSCWSPLEAPLQQPMNNLNGEVSEVI